MASLEVEMKIAREERARMAIEFEERLSKGEEVRREMLEEREEMERRMEDLMDEYKVLRELMMIQQEEMRKLLERKGFFTKMGEKIDDFFTFEENERQKKPEEK